MSFVKYSPSIEKELQKLFDEQATITSVKAISGGSINQCYSFQFGKRTFFIKENSSHDYPNMFEKEMRGLQELQRCKSIVVPKPLLNFETGERQFIVLEYLEPTPDSTIFYEELGKGIALLHKVTNESFGFEASNYIGSHVQENKKSPSWTEFFITQRIEPFVKWCYDEKFLSKINVGAFQNLYQALPSIFPPEQPSLLHGDLWSGNKMNTSKGAAIFDPAIYYGHREMDIAMTYLFGGFQKGFYEAYEAEYPLEKDYKKRIDICNLYPLLVHVRLFGTGYLPQALSIIKRF